MKFGVREICDVVLNHMANDNTGQGYSERINEYEPEIYQNKETYFHQYDKFYFFLELSPKMFLQLIHLHMHLLKI